MTSPGKFRPKSLKSESLEVPMRPEWNVMGAAEAQRLHEEALARHRKFQPFAQRIRKRLIRYVVGTTVASAFLCWFFVTGLPKTVLFFALAGIPLGAAVAILRPNDFLTGLLYAVAALTAILCAGGTNVQMAAMAALLFGCIGIAVGRGEEMKRFDLED